MSTLPDTTDICPGFVVGVNHSCRRLLGPDVQSRIRPLIPLA